MRRRLLLPILLAASGILYAQQKSAATVQLPPRPLLPTSFAGWTAVSTPIESTTAPAGYAAGLAEYGFKRIATATYNKGKFTLNLKAEQFADTTGAYGAFTIYGGSNYGCDSPCEGTIQPIGSGGIRDDDHTAFWIGDTFVDVHYPGSKPYERIVPPQLNADLQQLANELPIPSGSSAQPPALPNYLPRSGLNPALVWYSLGPNSFGSPSPIAGKLDFNTGAEVVVGQYGIGTLTLIEYPTPQMAAAQLKTFASEFNLQPQKSLPQGLIAAANIIAWRSGLIVALTSGIPQPQAIKLASEVHYESELTWNHPEGYVSEAWKAAHLYLGIAALSGILCGTAVFLGLFFGGARAIVRVLQGKPASAVADAEFISLGLGHGGDYRKLDDK